MSNISASVQIPKGENRMANNVNQSKTYRIYIKSTEERVEVPEEFYREHSNFCDAGRQEEL